MYISNEIIKSIPDREYLSGFSEILKCGLIKKNKILEILIKNYYDLQKRNFSHWTRIISETLKQKFTSSLMMLKKIKED